MGRSGKHQHRPIKLKPPTSDTMNDENKDKEPFALTFTAPTIKACNRHMPEKWEKWELKYVHAWFAINPNPKPDLREDWAMQLAEEQLLNQMSGVQLNQNVKTACKAFKKSEWYLHYKRRLANWFKNARAGLKRGKIPGLPLEGDLSTAIDENQPAIAKDNLSNRITSTLTPYPSGSLSASYDDGDKETTPTPKMSYRRPDHDATPVTSSPVQPEAPPKATLDDLAVVAVEALERRKQNLYPEYAESVIYGAFLLLNLKG